jgi:hypothetical protein
MDEHEKELFRGMNAALVDLILAIEHSAPAIQKTDQFKVARTQVHQNALLIERMR